MHKLVILIESSANPQFDQLWPQFLYHAERIPGLRREATSRVSQVFYGNLACDLIHELFFDNYTAMHQGMASPEGQQAGRVLQSMTGGRVVLLFADHAEDDVENIRRYQKPNSETHAAS